MAGKRVLLVDDNELNREILKEILVDQGLIVEEAGNGSEAVAAVKEREPGHDHFILMDIEMPEMNGYDATAAIRAMQNRPDACSIPIIAMTANAFAEDPDSCSCCYSQVQPKFQRRASDRSGITVTRRRGCIAGTCSIESIE